MAHSTRFSKLVGGLAVVGCILSFAAPAAAQDAPSPPLKCFDDTNSGGHWSYQDAAALDASMPKTQKEAEAKVRRMAAKGTLGRYCQLLHRVVADYVFRAYDHAFPDETAKELRTRLRAESISTLTGYLDKVATWRDIIAVGRASFPHSRTTTRPIECTDDSHCKDDLVCNSRGMCVECNEDDDCDDGYACGRGNICVEKPAEAETAETDTDADDATPLVVPCPANQHRDGNGNCVQNAALPECPAGQTRGADGKCAAPASP